MHVAAARPGQAYGWPGCGGAVGPGVYSGAHTPPAAFTAQQCLLLLLLLGYSVNLAGSYDKDDSNSVQ